MSDFHLPARSTGDGTYSAVVTPESAGWTYSGLRILELAPSGRAELRTGPEEWAVLSLSGSATLTTGGRDYDISGRESVFTGVSDFVYLPRDTDAVLESPEGGRFALPAARCERRLTVRYGAATDVPVEIRGAGQATRQVNNFLAPGSFDTDKLCAVEVLTPGGNWSSYPPHKHDEDREGEAVLEEIYYFETRGMAFQRVYGSGPGREIDVLTEVATGDVILIPHGYHGPSMAAPGYDLYYLNVLGGPGEQRSMAFCDDPGHAWVRGSWDGVPIDPRVPFFSGRGR
ncbi:MAG TPA: 5-deoxy-glucuronate isomerase [Mycobacteriales bacterium]|jgi:5-deoxy-glucuronate isomerase|nr:5-deoxy-glucuronate isomerase [Mycobacteriales bacterium]